MDPKEHLLQHAAAKVRGQVQGPDLVFRSKREEVELDLAFARALDNPNGQKILRYLRSITLDAVAPPGVANEALQRLEGMRWIVSVIVNRVERGRK